MQNVTIILPPKFVFSEKKPNSIETVIRTINKESRFRQNLTVLCDQGAECGNDYHVVKIPTYQSKKDRAAKILEIVRDLKSDLLEVHQHAPTGYQLLSMCKDAIPSLLYRHNVVRASRNVITRWRHSRRYRAFSGHVFVSDFARDSFRNAFPEFAKSSYSVPNPIDFREWSSDGLQKEKLISFTGRAAPEKGLAELAQALVPVLNANPDWRAELALGCWDVHEAWAEAVTSCLEQFGSRCVLRKNIPLGAVKELLCRSQIAVVPSVWEEPFGLAALEAHAAGCAVISSGNGGLQEVSGPYAVYLDLVTSENVASALTGLIDDPINRANISMLGREFALKMHNVSARAKQLDKIRNELVGRVL